MKKAKQGNWYYRMSLSRKRGLWGLVFLSPWIFGFLAFFVRPFIQTVGFAFSEVEISLGNIDQTFIGLANFRTAFTVDTAFNQLMLTLAIAAMPMVAIIVIFSLLAAMLINGKYPGRSVVRTIFFIPIIMGASIAGMELVGGDEITAALTEGFGVDAFFGGDIFIATLAATGLPVEITGFVTGAIEGIFDVLAQAGVPVLIFLAGLQSIPPSLYEVAKIEGCTQYESFWKVTLPMISPMILLTTVYTIIEQFTRHSTMVSNEEIVFFERINEIGFSRGDFGLASAMVVVFILATLLVIGFVTWIMSKVVFYYD